MIHDLKVWPEYFVDIVSGLKMFEIRRNDRGFKVHDVLRFREWDPTTKSYSMRAVDRVVIYIFEGGTFGVEHGYCVMGIAAQKGFQSIPKAIP